MAETAGRKRLEPRMTRGSFKFLFGAVLAQIILSAMLMLLNLGIVSGREWEPVSATCSAFAATTHRSGTKKKPEGKMGSQGTATLTTADSFGKCRLVIN